MIKVTRFERIKNMSLEEMAKCIDKDTEIMESICKGFECPYMDKDGNLSNDIDCTNCIKKWLESEGEI